MTSDRTHLLRVRTPEGVAFTVRLASPVLRATAFMVDWAVVSVSWGILGAALSLLNLLGRHVAGLVMTVGYFVFSQGYTIATEWLWRGQTVG
ncbi:MAG: RDD family protein, partial [Opitutus sp.]|nr:RDD family protein [Opitutus sp.]